MIDGRIPPLETGYLDRVIETALAEDLGHGDITTESLLDPDRPTSAHLLAGQEAVLAGLEVFRRVFLHLDPGASFSFMAEDGEKVVPGRRILELSARCEAVFKGERTALNFVQHLSGVATRTRLFADRISDLPVALLDTRKTVPGLRHLEKYAVRVGGGGNHRFGLFDGLLIKDNHRKMIGDLRAAVAGVRSAHPLSRVEIECADLGEVDEALAAGAEIILLDNMSPADMREAVRRVGGRCQLEASGNITLENIREVASTGIDFISAGTIIHGATFVDLSLEVVGGPGAAGPKR